ncbi:flagellin [Bradyrhizobium oropedii]|uniref:flagellin n=1 Tax=Bradyrhizobium oropedii TaxID=1571201 RepID=UPI001E3ACBC3|nr:flagellin [Bradyrhizobium oropedii]
MTTRRTILAAALALSAFAVAPARAEDKPAEIRIGTQKGGLFPAVRQRHTVEDAFKPLGIEVKWIDFQFGPPLLEAINVGSVDFGFVGDTPPIFAQAGAAKIEYVAAVTSDGSKRSFCFSVIIATGEYLFSGARTDTAPADLSTYGTGTGSLTTTDTSYYKGDSEIASVRVSDSQSISYGVTADNPAFEQVMRLLKYVGNSTTLTSSDISQALDVASTALDATSTVQAKLSTAASQIETASTNQSDYQNFAKTLSTNLTSVDVAAVPAQLSTYQAQLTASYSAIAKIQCMNLANYLK